MSTINARPVEARRQPEEDDPFRLGWRYVRQVGADGQPESVQVPLTDEDVLHPQEGDFIVNNVAHKRDCTYLENVLSDFAAARPGTVSLHDCRIDWGVEGVKPHGPDHVVFVGVQGEWDPHKGTFHPKAHQSRPVLVIEVTSESTRDKDLGKKVTEYHQAGIPLYVIVDELPEGPELDQRLIGFRAEPEGYVRLPLDALGRLWLEPVRLWLAWEGDRVVALDEQGNPVPDYTDSRVETRDARRQAEDERRARQAAELAQQAAERARQDAERARQDAELARQTAEQDQQTAERARQDAELARQTAELAQQTAELARQDAERRANDQAAEMALLLAELKRLRGQG